MRIYFYKLTADNGGAPCVQDGFLSLAICKPMIRSTGEPGDLIFGFAANSLHRDNRLIYIARIRKKVHNGDYYREKRFASRSDRIYEWHRSRFSWRHGALHHGPKHLVHDLGRPPKYKKASVLLSTDFRYFGASGTAEYKSRFQLVKEAVEQLGRGHRVTHAERLRIELIALKQQIWKNSPKRVAGEPTSTPRRDVCHRSRSCGVLAKKEVVG
ncbi:MAG: hypothetical protein HYY45_01305 [Deltaproteobacteria bacterium]|nr:hypothetical protein [Deltaproteobacteria bacterium]